MDFVDDEPELKIMHPIKASAFESTTVVELSGIQHIIALNTQGNSSSSSWIKKFSVYDVFL